ncbi:hypothetical protein HHL22_01055 [Hymenobacter sp. RP-2-7]|uniref:Uncharacterized protein n=1 Tax=Hymenobacter polaris TaxID=2682546 RepID=A0A7Y0AAK3_9BACT|nr:hypothetical protein [Hymenobacter polaris]NML63783.1 hypothetical protein [Hymenobacter polaris]
MNTFCTSLALGLLGLAACQSGKTTQQAPNPQAVPPAGQVASAAAAKAAVAYYLSQQPNRQLYVTDSARVLEVGSHYQVLVPRTDWAGRMPNRAAFEVDKATGTVSTRPVK